MVLICSVSPSWQLYLEVKLHGIDDEQFGRHFAISKAIILTDDEKNKMGAEIYQYHKRHY